MPSKNGPKKCSKKIVNCSGSNSHSSELKSNNIAVRVSGKVSPELIREVKQNLPHWHPHFQRKGIVQEDAVDEGRARKDENEVRRGSREDKTGDLITYSVYFISRIQDRRPAVGGYPPTGGRCGKARNDCKEVSNLARESLQFGETSNLGKSQKESFLALFLSKIEVVFTIVWNPKKSGRTTTGAVSNKYVIITGENLYFRGARSGRASIIFGGLFLQNRSFFDHLPKYQKVWSHTHLCRRQILERILEF